MPNKKDYRKGVGIVLINKNNKTIFAGKRFNTSANCWQMPQGGIEFGETTEEAARRELLEETNISSISIISKTQDWLYYDIPPKFLPKYWDSKYIGQMQKWILMEFNSDDSEINVNTSEPEFSEWSWLSSDEILENIIDFKRQLYIDIFREFREYIK